MSVHQVHAVLWKSEGRVGAPGTVVTDSSNKWILGTESRSSVDQPVLLTARPCFQPHHTIDFKSSLDTPLRIMRYHSLSIKCCVQHRFEVNDLCKYVLLASFISKTDRFITNCNTS